MKRKTLEFNLAEMSETKLIQMLDENNADAAELFGLLDALFHMWSAALKFSATVVQYGENHHEHFMETFVQNAAHQHGVSPDRLKTMLDMIADKRAGSSPALH